MVWPWIVLRPIRIAFEMLADYGGGASSAPVDSTLDQGIAGAGALTSAADDLLDTDFGFRGAMRYLVGAQCPVTDADTAAER